MRKSKLFLLFGLTTMLLSSCIWQLASVSYTAYTINEGQTTKAVLKVRPQDKTAQRMYVFVMTGVSNVGNDSNTDNDYLGVGKHVWDTGKAYNGPKTMVRHDALRDHILSNDLCSTTGFNASDLSNLSWQLYRTPGQVNDRGRASIAKITSLLRARSNAGGSLTHQVVHAIGVWVDDENDGQGDGVFTNDSPMCSSGSFTFIRVRP